MLDFKTILRAIKHQKRELIGITLLTLLVGVYAIFSLPSIYISSAKILVEREGLFSESDPSRPADDNVSRRMHAIRSTVLSSESIREILNENKMVEAEIDDVDLNLAISQFRDNASLEFDNVAVINQYTGKSGMFSQGMNIEYEHPDADIAFSVTTALTNRVLEANKGKGAKAVEYRRSFLVKEYQTAFDKLSEAKGEVAGFKVENALYLPEVHPLTIRRFQEIESQTVRAEENISRLRRDLADISGELATSSADAFVLAADGTRILGADEQLRLLEAEYARVLSRYTAQHPEVIRLRSELDGLRKYAGRGDASGIESDIQQARLELSQALERYSDDHPDVVALQQKITSLQSLKKYVPTGSRPSEASSASNPAYNRILIRQRSTRDDISRETQKLESLRDQLSDVKDQLARMPAVEQQLDTLLQRQDVTAQAYEEIEMEVEKLSLSYGMQQADLLDRFVLLEPPQKPLLPAKPQKKILLLILAVLAMGIGFLTALLLHLVRDKILDSDDVEEIVDLPIYMIPKLS